MSSEPRDVSSYLLYPLMFLQLQKASMEMSQTKEDMKALQKDLANADKEISVRQRILRRPETDTDYFVCLSVLFIFVYFLLESQEKGGDPPENSEHADTDQRSHQPTGFWEVCWAHPRAHPRKLLQHSQFCILFCVKKRSSSQYSWLNSSMLLPYLQTSLFGWHFSFEFLKNYKKTISFGLVDSLLYWNL